MTLQLDYSHLAQVKVAGEQEAELVLEPELAVLAR